MFAWDLETNGLDTHKYTPIIQFGWAHDLHRLDLPSPGQIDAVLGYEYASPSACAVHGEAPKLNKASATPNHKTSLEAACEIIRIGQNLAMSGNHTVCGYNIGRFDSRVLRRHLTAHGLETFDVFGEDIQNIDLLNVLHHAYWLESFPGQPLPFDATNLPLNEKGRPLFSLEAVGKHIGLDVDGAHNAAIDSGLTLALMQYIKNTMPQALLSFQKNTDADQQTERLDWANANSDHPQPIGVGVVGAGYPYATAYMLAGAPPTAQGGYIAWKATDPKKVEALLKKSPEDVAGAMALPEAQRNELLGSSPAIGVIYPGLMNLYWCADKAATDNSLILPKKRSGAQKGFQLIEEAGDDGKALISNLFSEGVYTQKDPHPRNRTGRELGLSNEDRKRLKTIARGLANNSLNDIFQFNPQQAAREFAIDDETRPELEAKITDIKWRHLLASHPEKIDARRMGEAASTLLKSAKSHSELADRCTELTQWHRGFKASLPDQGAHVASQAEIKTLIEKRTDLAMKQKSVLDACESHNQRLDDIAELPFDINAQLTEPLQDKELEEAQRLCLQTIGSRKPQKSVTCAPA